MACGIWSLPATRNRLVERCLTVLNTCGYLRCGVLSDFLQIDAHRFANLDNRRGIPPDAARLPSTVLVSEKFRNNTIEKTASKSGGSDPVTALPQQLSLTQ